VNGKPAAVAAPGRASRSGKAGASGMEGTAGRPGTAGKFEGSRKVGKPGKGDELNAPATSEKPVKSERRAPVETPLISDTGTGLLYGMSRWNRVMLEAIRVWFFVMVLVGLLIVVMPGEGIGMRMVGVVTVALLALWMTGLYKQTRSIVLAVQQEGAEMRFRRWDGREVVVPRRGKALRKDRRSNAALIMLQTAEGTEGLSLLAQDKKLTPFMEDLDRRGILRGPGAPKKPFPPGGPMGPAAR